MSHDVLNVVLQYLASGAGAIGAGLMALRISQPRYAYYIWITGDILFIPYCIATSQWGILGMNLVYLAINLVGIARWRDDSFGVHPSCRRQPVPVSVGHFDNPRSCSVERR